MDARRLFIAIPIPDSLQREIYRVFSNIRFPRVERLRIVPEGNWHFTVLFLGNQEETVIDAIRDSIEQAIAHREKTEVIIALDAVTYGPFPPRGDARGIWLTTDKESSHKIGFLKNSLEIELKKRGVTWEEQERTYQGHLTLARFESVPIRTLPPLRVPVGRSYRAEAIRLVESHLSRKGAEYETVFEIPL